MLLDSDAVWEVVTELRSLGYLELRTGDDGVIYLAKTMLGMIVLG